MLDSTYPLTIYYDGDCPVCRDEMRYLEARDRYAQLRFVNIAVSDPATWPPGSDRPSLMSLIHARCADGRVLRGVEVFRLAYAAAGSQWVARLTNLPGIRGLCEAAYPVIARHRYRLPAKPFHWLFMQALRRTGDGREATACSEQCRNSVAGASAGHSRGQGAA